MLGLILACGTLGFHFENIRGIKQRYRRRHGGTRRMSDERRGNVRRRGGNKTRAPTRRGNMVDVTTSAADRICMPAPFFFCCRHRFGSPAISF